jgi:hypothetical protein
MIQNALFDPLITPDAKHKFGVTCPVTLFVQTTLGPPEHEN